ncbi:MAG TPA: SRPBCC family protein [Mycobacteriales bacterium]|nr:SRPBCC family protein [Mycobacteriales bacterium]
MDLQNAFTVPVPVDEAWPVLLDVQRVAPCMPGATLLSVDGDEFTGTVKVKIGPVQMTYKGSAKFVETDEGARRAVIEASGKDTRGGGTAAATVTLQAKADGDATRVEVTTDLNITGRPAQFGRGVLAEVSGKLVDQFAGSLSKEMQSGAKADIAVDPTPPDVAVEVDATSPPTASTSDPVTPPRPPAPPAEAIDLLSVAGGSVVKRLAPVGGVVALLLLALMWRRRRRA